ncbi:MAG: DUF547 domain-containing protein [Kangiellaceae bacterium]
MKLSFIRKIGTVRLVISSISGILALSSMQANSEEQLSTIFGGHSPDSTYTIGYEDYDLLLKQNVLDLGHSFRKKASRSVARTGTRLKAKRNLQTALEGNRFFFKNFKTSERKQLLTNIRVSLETLPDELALKEFNKNVQLAFWFNLYNVTLLENLVNIAPRTNMKEYLYGDDSILDKKLIVVDGIKLSLNNIQYDIILPNYNENPNVIYGFFQGIIGAPNLRSEAYTGKNVQIQLKKNGQEFVNSNRGTYGSSSENFRVSSIYQRNKNWFPDFNNDLKKHLLELIETKDSQKIKNTNEFRVDIEDMSFANLSGGFRDFGMRAVSGSAQMSSVEGLSISQYMNFASNAELELFRDLMMNSHIQRPKLTEVK